jgi:tetratricopeptide (TPR) repeat protein
VIFKKNIEAFPENAALYDSYAEAWAHQGDYEKAQTYYELAYKGNKDNINSKEILRHLK